MSNDNCETCQEHSGVVNRNTLLLWLLGLLIVIGATQTTILVGVKEQIAGFQFRFIGAEAEIKDLKDEVREIHDRVGQLERYEIGHRENRD